MNIQRLLFIIVFFLEIFISMTPLFAADSSLVITYEPKNSQFKNGSENVVYVFLSSQNGGISAAKISLQATGGLQIISLLSPRSSNGSLVQNVKIVDQKIVAKTASETSLFLSAAKDLPSIIKIPVVVKGATGNLKLDTNASQVLDENGKTLSLSQPAMAYVVFTENGKDSSPLPASDTTNSATVHLSVKFQGIEPSSVKNTTMDHIKIQLVNGKIKSKPQFISANMDGNGIWHADINFPNIKPTKDVAILIKGPKHLQKRICETAPTESTAGSYSCNEEKIDMSTKDVTIDASHISLMAGDLGLQDGFMNSYDISLVHNAIKKTADSTNEMTDINMDGKTDKTDYDLLVYTLTHTFGQDE